jgi:hypothetical protein
VGPISDAHKLTYSSNVALAVQQKRSRLDMGFSYQSGLSGRQSTLIELIGSASAVVDLGRKADTPDIDNSIEPVWITPRQLAWGKLIEKEDAIKALTDYQSPFVQAGAAAMVRGKDVILSQRCSARARSAPTAPPSRPGPARPSASASARRRPTTPPPPA